MQYKELTLEQRRAEYEVVLAAWEAEKRRGLRLNMARGNQSAEQLDMTRDLLTDMTRREDCLEDGADVCNYGQLSGLSSAKRLFAELLGCRSEQLFVGGNASLSLQYDTIAKAITHGLLHSESPWSQQGKLKWLCPSPGYDRHFKITASFGFELITVPMTEEGPDMDLVEELIRDPAVKGMWNVPKYSNPTGITYSDETIRRLAAMKPAAPDFLLMWDNAYCLHEFEGDFVPFPDILQLCEEAGNADMVFEFASTSKVTLTGAGISCFACSEANMEHMVKLISLQIISYDKVNQLRHVRFLKNKENTLSLMQRHAAILRPKFHLVLDKLEQDIAPLGIAYWHRPTGGYFISLDTTPGLAKRTLELCRQAGVTMTEAGACFPYGVDPQDRNIRIAPTTPALEELRQAMDIFCLSLRLAALEQLGV